MIVVLLMFSVSVSASESGDNLYRIADNQVEQLSTLVPAPPMTIDLKVGEIPLARYRYISVPFKPYIDELRTPTGRNILRDAPWDHLHHHGLMYALRVGEHSFWDEADPRRVGTQVTENIQFAGNSLESEISWNNPDARTLLKETRKITVKQGNNVTLLDWETTLTAVEDTTLSGQHYYGLGMRFLQEMDKGGRYFNDTGLVGEIVHGDERLTRCQWMAYTARLGEQPVTVALFDHPANPVPMSAFTMGEVSGAFAYLAATMNLHRVPVELKAGETFAVRYRVALWDGEVTPEIVIRAYAEYVE